MTNFKPLSEVPGHPGFYALPTDPEQLALLAKVSAGMRGVDPLHVSMPATKREREVVWRTMNENFAQLSAEDTMVQGEKMTAARSALFNALGRTPPATTPETVTPAALASARIKALSDSRAACGAIIAAGYEP
ncbi:hypothetical protein SAMN05428969_2835 [Devosia sp. YR412]|uniref:hypothetical protein n=1 Tax=Devosia sp. YR412 TaxID=1881030 RepID=UPI0008C57FEC|nr:hypothetical protein [Devosia sp. YR412]SEQ37998.1 hypothetical protein SAMN05428969_2835 [Devosia sp. YR412]